MPLARHSARVDGLGAVVVDREGRIRIRDLPIPAPLGREEQTIAAPALRMQPPDRPPRPGVRSIWIPCIPIRTPARADDPFCCRVLLGPRPNACVTVR